MGFEISLSPFYYFILLFLVVAQTARNLQTFPLHTVYIDVACIL